MPLANRRPNIYLQTNSELRSCYRPTVFTFHKLMPDKDDDLTKLILPVRVLTDTSNQRFGVVADGGFVLRKVQHRQLSS